MLNSGPALPRRRKEFDYAQTYQSSRGCLPVNIFRGGGWSCFRCQTHRPVDCYGKAALLNTRFATAVVVVWMALFLCPTPALAYVDPGSGGMMMQLLLGGVAGIVVLLRMYWQRFTTFIGLRKADSETSDGLRD
jgi:hypothetical protein